MDIGREKEEPVDVPMIQPTEVPAAVPAEEPVAVPAPVKEPVIIGR